jgi:hypothetical protein
MNRKKGLKLFTPVKLGSLNLKHRVVMARLTRSRSEQPGGIPGDMMVQYYSDRASDGVSLSDGSLPKFPFSGIGRGRNYEIKSALLGPR